MSRRVAGALAATLVAVALAGCGVDDESAPEPLPPITPLVLPPSVTQEPAPATPTPAPTPQPGATGSDLLPR